MEIGILAAGMAMRQRGKAGGVVLQTLAVATLLLGIFSAPTEAQNGFRLSHYRPAATVEEGFAVAHPITMGHLGWSLQLHLDYSNDPLVFEQTFGDAGSEQFAVVAHQLVAQANFAISFYDRLLLYVGMPIGLVMTGDELGGTTIPESDGPGPGDPWLGVRLRLYSTRDRRFSVGAEAEILFPLGRAIDGGQSYVGGRSLGVRPRLLFSLRAHPRIQIGLNAGLAIRERAEIENLIVDDEITFGLGVVARLFDEPHVEGYAELFASTPLDSNRTFDRELSPLELLVGGRIRFPNRLVVGLAGGPGLLRGYGSPDLRVIAMVGIGPAAAEIEEAPPPPGPADADGDGLLDDVDECRDEPEDNDDFEDDDGCPDPDNDQDGVPDEYDGAPLEPEDDDDFEDRDGVPEPDNDGDGILDGDDDCPLLAEDRDGLQDTDGCPERDADGDTVLDVDDRCPLTVGVENQSRAECHGCPARACVTESGQIIILERVEFASSRDRILERSLPVLEDVKAILDANPQVTRLRIEGHTDSQGSDRRNLALSRGRAGSVRRWLVANGVADARLEAWGCGEAHAIDNNRSRAGRQANRRVEFHIVSPAPEAGARQLEGCERAAETDGTGP